MDRDGKVSIRIPVILTGESHRELLVDTNA